MKCENCKGFGYVEILNNADEIVEMECPICDGIGYR
jgi:excinuclease UvrABC ATPase subunit